MNNTKTKKLFFLGLFALTTMMCVFPNLDTENFVRAEPKTTELVGRYVPTAGTIKLIREAGKYEIDEDEITLLLTADGKFEMKNMPDWWNTDFGKPEGGKDSGEGSWRVVAHQDWWDVQFDFDSREHFSSARVESGFITSAPIVGDAPPYFLWFYVGDSDSGKVMIFERILGE
jgi:hypothetical protein